MEANLLLPRTFDPRFEAFHFDDALHKYTLGSKVLPGITGIIKACRYVDTRYYTQETRDRGTHVHLAVKYLHKGTLDWSSVLDSYVGYVMAYERFAREWNLKVSIFERPMFHPDLLFAGTPDIVGTVLDNVPSIVELKTGPVMKWTALQTIAQELLVRAWADDKSIRYRRWGVTLNADGTYSKPKEFIHFERDEAAFRMLNSAVQDLGTAKAEMVFELLGRMTREERQSFASPLYNAVVEHRELYAA